MQVIKPSPKHSRRSEEHTSELQSHVNLVCRLLLDKKKTLRNRLCAPRANTRRSLRSERYAITMAAVMSPPRICSNPVLRIFRIPSSSFFFNDTATTEIYTLSLHDALPI